MIWSWNQALGTYNTCFPAEEMVQVAFDEPVAMDGIRVTAQDAQLLVAQAADVLRQVHASGQEAVRQQADGRGGGCGLFPGVGRGILCGLFLRRAAGGVQTCRAHQCTKDEGVEDVFHDEEWI